MFPIQRCLVKKRKIAAACALQAEKSERHQLQRETTVSRGGFVPSAPKILSHLASNRPLGARQCLHLHDAGRGGLGDSVLSPKPEGRGALAWSLGTSHLLDL